MSVALIRETSKLAAAKLFHLLERPEITSNEEKLAAFHVLRAGIRGGAGSTIPYDLPYPKHEFLQFLVENEDLILHGSNRSDITHLEPQRQTTFFGRVANVRIPVTLAGDSEKEGPPIPEKNGRAFRKRMSQFRLAAGFGGPTLTG